MKFIIGLCKSLLKCAIVLGIATPLMYIYPVFGLLAFGYCFWVLSPSLPATKYQDDDDDDADADADNILRMSAMKPVVRLEGGLPIKSVNKHLLGYDKFSRENAILKSVNRQQLYPTEKRTNT